MDGEGSVLIQLIDFYLASMPDAKLSCYTDGKRNSGTWSYSNRVCKKSLFLSPHYSMHP
jgi:hypothetical protein